jgi:hypothetical protein
MEALRQIWAEALVYYRAGESLFLDGRLSAFAVKEQREAMESDDREGLVREYLMTLLPDNWSSMSLYERKRYLNGDDFSGKPMGTVRRERVCVLEIWCECFEKDRGSLKRQDANEIDGIMAKIEGWKKSEGKMRFPHYGVVRGYVNVADE